MKTKVALALALVLTILAILYLMATMKTISEAAYEQGFLHGCRDHDVYMAENENGLLKGLGEDGESHAECPVLWANWYHDEYSDFDHLRP